MASTAWEAKSHVLAPLGPQSQRHPQNNAGRGSLIGKFLKHLGRVVFPSDKLQMGGDAGARAGNDIQHAVVGVGLGTDEDIAGQFLEERIAIMLSSGSCCKSW